MSITLEFTLVLLVQVLTIGVFVGSFKATMKYIQEKLDKLEKKQDKHNSLIERMVAVEQAAKAAHQRLDGLKGG